MQNSGADAKFRRGCKIPVRISGLNLTFVDQMLPRKTRVIRIMPNTPVLVRSGTSVFSCGTSTRPSDAALAKRFFSAVGLCEEVPEVLIDSCTGLSGSGPAYVSSPSNSFGAILRTGSQCLAFYQILLSFVHLRPSFKNLLKGEAYSLHDSSSGLQCQHE